MDEHYLPIRLNEDDHFISFSQLGRSADYAPMLLTLGIAALGVCFLIEFRLDII